MFTETKTKQQLGATSDANIARVSVDYASVQQQRWQAAVHPHISTRGLHHMRTLVPSNGSVP
jgi:hypothetical protein